MHELMAETAEQRVIRIEVGGLPSEIAPAMAAALERLSEGLIVTQKALTETIRFVAGLAAGS